MLLVDATQVAKNAADLTVVDRTCFFFPGIAVMSVSNLGGQAGVVTRVATELDLARLGGGGGTEPHTVVVVATAAPAAEVRPVSELNVGDYVVSGTWVGRVVEVSVDVDVVFGDGSVCRVTGAGDINKLRVVTKNFWNNHHKNAFYPGDGVAGDASVFKASRWLKGYWKPTHGGEGTVAKVKMGGVLVCWLASLEMGAPPPASYQPNARSLTFFCSGGKDMQWSWAVGGRCFFRSPNKQRVARKKKPRRNNVTRMGLKHRRRSIAEFKRPMAVADTRTTVDVLWQDGTQQRGVPSASLQSIQVRNEQDFFPGQRVIAKTVDAHGSTDNVVNPSNNGGRAGIVKSLSYKDQTVCVSWIAAAPGEESSEVADTNDEHV